MPPRGYRVVTLRAPAYEALERVQERLGSRSLSEALEELVRRVETFAPELLECSRIERLEDGAYVCRG